MYSVQSHIYRLLLMAVAKDSGHIHINNTAIAFRAKRELISNWKTSCIIHWIMDNTWNYPPFKQLGPVVYPPQVTCDMRFVPAGNSNGTDKSNIVPEQLPKKVWWA